MTHPGFGHVLRYLRGAVAPPAAGALDDAHLLARFLDRSDETAYEALVRRHGPMVLGVARTVLNDSHDAEDVFQATFLVLAQKAHALSKRESLASWLYGVAYRIALNTRARAARRRKHERRVVSMSETQATDEGSRDLRPLIVEELNRLPEKYRAPLVLCYLQGLTNDEAAAQLRWPSGTVKGRLARAREVLRGRLAKRGPALTGTAWAVALADNGISAAVPPALVSATMVRTCAVPVALGQLPLSGLTGQAAELARQSLQHSLWVRAAVGALVAVSLAAGGAGAFWLVRTTVPPAGEQRDAAPDPQPRLVAAFAEEQYRGMPVPVAFSADGKRLAVLAQRDSEAPELFLQEVASGAKVATVTLADKFRSVASNGTALVLVYAEDFPASVRAEVRDLVNLNLVREWKDDKVRVTPSEVFLAGDTLILVGGQAEDLQGGAAGGFGGFGGGGGAGMADQGGTALGLYDLTGKAKPIVHVLKEADTWIAGQPLVIGAKPTMIALLQRDDDYRVEAIDPIGGKQRKIADKLEASALAASADGAMVAVQTAEDTLLLWDAAAGKAGPKLRDGDTTIVCFAFSPSGRIVATAGSDRQVKLWDVQTGKVTQQLAQARVQHLLFSADGRFLAAASPEEVRIWRTEE